MKKREGGDSDLVGLFHRDPFVSAVLATGMLLDQSPPIRLP